MVENRGDDMSERSLTRYIETVEPFVRVFSWCAILCLVILEVCTLKNKDYVPIIVNIGFKIIMTNNWDYNIA